VTEQGTDTLVTIRVNETLVKKIIKEEGWPEKTPTTYAVDQILIAYWQYINSEGVKA
jgi:hypothetical protein